MGRKQFRAPGIEGVRRPYRLAWRWLPAAAGLALLTIGGRAQMTQPPSHPPKPLIVPEANPMPDANDQMEMRQKNLKMRNFDAINVERRREMMRASDILQTLAMALKAKVDKPEPLSENDLQKAENIEKLAHAVKERMKLSLGPN